MVRYRSVKAPKESVENLLPNKNAVHALRRKLLRWFDQHQRDLPWRSNEPNPWHVFVSEAMLQQTQVATVIDYFNRFVTTWPTPQAMAEADEQAVLRMWQGLGYYRRARNLHAAAKMIVADFDGHVPDTAEALETLPGVGRYTAGAVASIAFGKREPIVDGNVARVVARWFAIEQPTDDTKVKAHIWELAGELVPPGRPGDFNQAMMELGALVCLPRNAHCLTCPAANLCEANARGLVDQLPRRTPKRAPQEVTHHVLAIRKGNQYLFEQRPSKGLWSNMWQMPTAAPPPPEDFKALIGRLGVTVSDAAEIGQFTHQTTHRTIRFVVHHAAVTGGRLKRGAGVWRSLTAIDDLPLAKAQLRVVELVAAQKKKPTA